MPPVVSPSVWDPLYFSVCTNVAVLAYWWSMWGEYVKGWLAVARRIYAHVPLNCSDKKKKKESLQLMWLFFTLVLQHYGIWMCYSGGRQWHSRATEPRYQNGTVWKEMCIGVCEIHICYIADALLFEICHLHKLQKKPVNTHTHL